MWYSGDESPLDDREREWIDEHMTWFHGEFGDGSLHRPVVLPTDEFFPGVYTGTPDEVRDVVNVVCEYVELDPERVELEIESSSAHAMVMADLPGSWESSGAAGHYLRRDGRALIRLDESLAARPLGLVATIAHELCHERLLGEDRVAADREDHEPLTDLLTVYFGLGVFTANAAFEFAQSDDGGRYGWQWRRLGYLTEPMFGYALARFAWMRGETRPEWRKYVDGNPGSYLKKGLRFIEVHADDLA